MNALPIEEPNDETRIREDARLQGRQILRGRIGVIRSLGTDVMRDRVSADISERVGVAGSLASED
jgi:hypothetical protein